jgi:hypothetical protein
MTDFASKNASNVNIQTFSLHDKYMPDSHTHATVDTMSGLKLNLKTSQIPAINIYRNNNQAWRYQSNGDLSTILTTGGEVLIQIDRSSGSGPSHEVYLRMIITNNTGAEVEMVDCYSMLENIEFQTPSGQQIQQFTGRELRSLAVRFFDRDHWRRTAKIVNSNQNYGKGFRLAIGELRLFYVPLIGQFLSTGNYFCPHTDGDINVYVRFKPQSLSVVNGTAPTLTQLQLDVKQEYMKPVDRDRMSLSHKTVPHHYFILFPKRQVWNQILNANTAYDFYLNGIKGDVCFIDFAIVRSKTGYEQRNFVPIGDFQIFNNEGDQITSQNPIESDRYRYSIAPEIFPSDYTLFQPYYSYSFASEDGSPMSVVYNAMKLGSYPFTTHERLLIHTGPAGTSEVVNISPGTTFNAGQLQIVWETPFGTSTSNPITWNATNATVKAEIEKIIGFEGTVTLTGVSIADNSGINITFGGAYTGLNLYGRGFRFKIDGYDSNGGTGPCPFSVNLVTAGVEGIISGSNYILEVTAWCTGILKVSTNGQLEVKAP